MPQLPPAEGVIKVIPRYLLHGSPVLNVLHYVMLGPKTIAAMEALAQNWFNVWTQNIRTVLSSNLELQDITCVDLSAAPLSSITIVPTGTRVGQGSASGVPSHVALVVSLRTALRGRSYRGRIYVPGLNEPDVTGNQVSQSIVTAFQGGFTSLMRIQPAGGAVDAQQVVLSYYANKQLRPTPAATPVTSVAVNPRVDSQRRRLPR